MCIQIFCLQSWLVVFIKIADVKCMYLTRSDSSLLNIPNTNFFYIVGFNSLFWRGTYKVVHFSLNCHSRLDFPLSLSKVSSGCWNWADIRAEFEPLMFHFNPTSYRLYVLPIDSSEWILRCSLTHASVTLGYSRQSTDMPFFSIEPLFLKFLCSYSFIVNYYVGQPCGCINPMQH